MFSTYFNQPKFRNAKGYTQEWWQRRAFLILGIVDGQTMQQAIDLCMVVGRNAYDARRDGFLTSIWAEYAVVVGQVCP